MAASATRFPVLAAALCAAGLSAPGQADVLEMGRDGPAWVAGGPSPSAAVAEANLVLPSEGGHYTPIAITAGPAAWQPRVAELAAKYDISPQLLEAVVWQESRWRPGAVSSAGARGLAQLMPGTARELGVNPYDPSANLEGGARYLRQQLDAFDGNVEKALAAYNAGPGRVIDAGGIPNISETKNYVAVIMARLTNPVRR